MNSNYEAKYIFAVIKYCIAIIFWYLSYTILLGMISWIMFRFQMTEIYNLHVFSKIIVFILIIFNVFRILVSIICLINLIVLDSKLKFNKNANKYIDNIYNIIPFTFSVTFYKHWDMYYRKYLRIESDDIKKINFNLKSSLIHMFNCLNFMNFALVATYLILSIYKVFTAFSYVLYTWIGIQLFFAIQFVILGVLVLYLNHSKTRSNKLANYLIINGGGFFFNILWSKNSWYKIKIDHQ